MGSPDGVSAFSTSQDADESRITYLVQLVKGWHDQFATRKEESLQWADDLAHTLARQGRYVELYDYGEAFFRARRSDEALYFLKAFVDVDEICLGGGLRLAYFRCLVWQGKINERKRDGRAALESFEKCFSRVDWSDFEERAIGAEARQGEIDLLMSVTQSATEEDSEENRRMLCGIVRRLIEFKNCLVAWRDDWTRARVAYIYYQIGWVHAVLYEFPEAVVAFRATLDQSRGLDVHLPVELRRICAMRLAVISDLNMPPVSVDIAYVRRNLEWLERIKKTPVGLARYNTHAEISGRRLNAFQAVLVRMKVPARAIAIARSVRQEIISETSRSQAYESQARTVHASTCRYIQRCQIYGHPIIVFLRNFTFGTRTRAGEVPMRMFGGEAFDRSILEYYSALAPVVLISDQNTAEGDFNLPPGARPLYLSDETWATTIRSLIRRAALIVINAPFVTQSLASELQIIEEEKQADVTILIAQEVDLEGVKLANIVTGDVARSSIPVNPSDYRGRVGAAVHSSDPPSLAENVRSIKTAIDYIRRSAQGATSEENFLYLAEAWELKHGELLR